jgi:hypothetical protein
VATGYTGTISFSSSDPQAVLPANYTFTSADAGTHSFSVTLKTAGVQSLSASDTGSVGITNTESSITVNPAAAASLAVAGFPNTDMAGHSASVTVTARDRYGNVATGYTGTVIFTSSDAQAVLASPYTFTAANAGVHAFTIVLKTVGTQSINVSDNMTATIMGTQSGITVTPASTASLLVAGFPSSVTAGTAASFSITALDAYGNLTTGYTGTAVFSSSDPQAILPASYTFTAANAGKQTFTATLETAGIQSLKASGKINPNITGTESSITVTPAAAAAFAVTGFPSPDTAGTAGSMTVKALDAYGNVATGYTGTIKFTSSDAQASLPHSYTFTAANLGTASFTATLKTAGSESITATDTTTTTVTGTDGNITVQPAALSALKLGGFPRSDTAGSSGNITASAVDLYGNVVPSYTGTVSFSSSDAHAVLPSPYMFTGADAGTHAFSVVFETAGSQSITARDNAIPAFTGTESNIMINPASTSSLRVAGFPSPVTAGTAASFTVTAFDAYGNVATGYHGTIAFTSSDPQAILPANYTFTAANAGTQTFTATLKTPGLQSLKASGTIVSSITGTESGIMVNPAGGSALRVSGLPSPDTAGTSAGFTVTAVDPAGIAPIPDPAGADGPSETATPAPPVRGKWTIASKAPGFKRSLS